jgi:iron(III) transport system ATP-binding protein
MNSGITLLNLSKTFVRRSGEVVRAIDDVTLDINPGEFLVLLGPSGCGKTTMLRSIAGLETPSQGKVIVNDTPLFDAERRLAVPPEQRKMGMIFQSYALWPHMTVYSNVAYPLKMRGVPGKEIRARVHETLALVGIPELTDQYPGQISGGQQQRTALARALVGGSQVVLFDEPLSNGDAKVREQLRFEIKKMHDELGFTGVYVTHDQEEAMALGTRIAVMRAGKIDQLGSSTEVY